MLFLYPLILLAEARFSRLKMFRRPSDLLTVPNVLMLKHGSLSSLQPYLYHYSVNMSYPASFLC